MNILGIETSCDETALAIYSEENGLIANSLHSQVDLFKEYGVKIKVKTTGKISGLTHAEKIIKTNQADLISFGRKFINSPTWLIKEMISNKKQVKLSNQYKRCF